MKKPIITLLFILGQSVLLFGQEFTKLTYFKNDTQSLDLDLFLPSAPVNSNTPLIIFVHGGGFEHGRRTEGHVFCKYLAAHGFAAASISYTLYMKDKDFSCGGNVPEKIKAIQFGANDLWLATSFLLKRKEQYHIDATKIFIAGSSAGAETALHAAFWDMPLMSLYDIKLPESFRYAGVISGSGAIMDLNLINSKTAIPVLLFHGNGDSVVPYATAAHHYCKTNSTGWLMLFGSYSIYNHFVSLKKSAHLFTYCGGGHEYSAELFNKNQQPVVDFLNAVIKGKEIKEHTIVATGKKNERSAAYRFCD